MTNEVESIEANRRDVLHTMLVALRDETYERVRELRHEQTDNTELAPGDEMDRAHASVDLETYASLIARAEERLRCVDEALARVDAGRYGICAACREPIGVERLSAVPFALYCVDCQQSRNRAGRGWSDGTMIEPFDHQWTLPGEMEEQPEYTTGSPEVLAVSSGSPFGEGRPETKTETKTTPPRSKRKRGPRSVSS